MINILMIDDDPVFAQDFQKRLMELPEYSPKAISVWLVTDVSALNEDMFSRCHMVFLDIDLGEENGIDLARKLRRINPEAVLIFVTNFKEYAPEGYEVDAFRYLAKSELDQKLQPYFSDALKVCRGRQQTVEILCEGETVSVPTQALVYIESMGHDQYLYLKGSPRERLRTRWSITELEELLRTHGFLRIHKSFLVNMRYLQSLQSTGAVLTTGKFLPVGARSYRINKQKFITWQAQQI